MTNAEYYAKVAELLGLELDEEFKIKSHEYNYYKICEDKIMVKSGRCDDFIESAISFKNLTPETIIKLPWRPKVGEKYWFLAPIYPEGVDGYEFNNDTMDNRILNRIDIYKTKEEAVQVAKAKGWYNEE